MSDITGNAFTIHAAEKLEKAIEHVGYTSSQQQVGKGISAKVESTSTGYNARGARFCTKNDTKVEFLGVVKAVTSEAQGEFARTKTLGNPVTGANPTYAPYFLGDVTVLEGQALTVERNCITYVLAEDVEDANKIKFGDLIACSDDGLFKKTTDISKAIGRAYSNQADNKYNVIRAYIEAI
ncbi:MAG: hypothetical protein IKF82_00230 [Bacilli bacterium]|nr:hypothetical protein [Bacilli bacterium]